MKNATLRRLLSFLMAVSMLMSITVMPAAATQTPSKTEHTCSYTTEEVITAATCGAAGEKKLSCSCGKFQTEAIPATGEHNYENGVCSVCQGNKPCTLAVDCDAPQHVDNCLSQASCTCVRLCAETMACPVCEGGGTCQGGEAADKIAAAQQLIDALPTQYTAEEREAAFAQYQACTEAIAALTDAQRNALNMDNYYAAAQPTVIPSEVTSAEALQSALDSGADTIVIKESLTVSETIEVSKPVTLNLNGKTITNNVQNGYLFQVNDTMTIQGGTGSILSGEDSGNDLVMNDGSTVTVTGGTFNGTFAVKGSDGTTVIQGGTFTNFGASLQDKGVLEITGGTFKTGDTVTNVSSYTSPGYTQSSTTGAVGKSEMPSTGTNAASSVENPDDNTVIPDTVSSITANEAVADVDTGLDTLYKKENLDKAVEELQKDPVNANQNLLGTTIRTTVFVTLTNVGTNADSTKVETLTFEVKPQIQAVDGDSKVVAATTIPNEQLTGKTITFRLPVVGTSEGKLVSVTHDENPIGTYTVQKSEDDLYIELETSSFSTFGIKLLGNDAVNVAKVGSVNFADMESAISYLQTNGGTLELLENVSTATTLTIPSGKTAVVDLKGKTYTYTGSNSAFVGSGTSLELKNGTVVANSGTLAQSTAGTMTIRGITYTSTGTTGNTLSANAGTVTISDVSFSGNAYSVHSSGTGVVAISSGTFAKGVAASDKAAATAANVIINGGTFNEETNAFTETNSGKISIPGTSTALFKTQPPAAMIEAHYSAVSNGSGMYRIQQDPYVTVNGTVQYLGASVTLDTILTASPAVQTVTLSREEAVNGNHTLTANPAVIDFAGNLIKGTGSITATNTVYLNNIGSNRLSVVLGPGDKAFFGSDGSVTLIAAENKNSSGKDVGYGEVKLTIPSSSGSISMMYFLATDASVRLNSNGTLTTTGHTTTASGVATLPNYTVFVDDGSSTHSNTFIIGSSKSLYVTSNGFYDGLSKITVNDKELSTAYYNLKSDDGISVTLSNTYLKSLSKGKYTITMHFLDGKSESANFYVANTASTATSPKTGDTIMAAVGIMAAAAAGLAVLLYIGKKKKK